MPTLSHTLLFTLLPSLLTALPNPLPNPPTPGQPNPNAGQRGQNSQGNNPQAGGNQRQPAVGKAIFFLSNEPAANAIIGLKIQSDGTLAGGTVTPTGQQGGRGVDPKTNEPLVPDGMFGQGALTLVGNTIFSTNAGSNTLTAHTISSSNPTQLIPLAGPAALPGTFPMSVAASAKNNAVCVAHSGSKSGISCAKINLQGGGGSSQQQAPQQLQFDSLRDFAIGQQDPPTGPEGTVSHVFFSSDETRLFTTVKGNPADNSTGFLSTFPVDARTGTVSQRDVRVSPAGTAVLFGSANIPGTQGTQLLVTDASFGAAIMDVNPANGDARVAAKTEIAGQKATCWVAISEATGTGFVTDVGVGRMVEVGLKGEGIVGVTEIQGIEGGMIDLAAAGNFLYALAPGVPGSEAKIVVMDVSGGAGTATVRQVFGLKGVAGNNIQGMIALK